ncbi:hypothetical protein DY000_02049502 [Brassica cretica]|uniref:Uncharacterized protein n=1 Tax=Brassica cretica TaxID=69181 RepID=A0ABQ7EXN0_BRACR|nr:hypothetical protein DY000_02049502 [Brassica cretica]
MPKSLRRRSSADFEPSERDIGELSQPPSTEIRSVTPPPFHALGNPRTAFFDWLSVGHLVNRRYLSNHLVFRDFKATSVFVTSIRVRGRSFIRRAAATRPHAQEEVSRVNLTRHRLRRTFAGATAAGHRLFAAGKPAPHHRRDSAAAGDLPVSHHRCWLPPSTGLRRLAGRLADGVHSYHFSTLLRKNLRRRTTADFEPLERDIGELSQPPSTEIRSVTPPPSHAAAVSRPRSFRRRAAAMRPHAHEKDSRVNLTRHRLRRTFTGATAASHRPFASGKPPPHHHRVSAAAGDFRGSETSGLAMLLVRACGAETFVPWMLLERTEVSCVFMLELNFHSGSSIYSSETDEQE